MFRCLFRIFAVATVAAFIVGCVGDTYDGPCRPDGRPCNPNRHCRPDGDLGEFVGDYVQIEK